jgi:hypothetical protein
VCVALLVGGVGRVFTPRGDIWRILTLGWYVVCSQVLRSCYTVDALLLHCCYTVVTLLLHC